MAKIGVQDRYPVLGAALALSEFTLEDLVERTGLGIESIRSVVRREERIQLITTQPTGRRGGQPNVFRLADEHVEEVFTELRTIFDSVRSTAMPGEAAGMDAAKSVPPSLRSVEQLLGDHGDTLSPKEQALLVRMALPSLRTARRDLQLASSGAPDSVLDQLDGFITDIESGVGSTPEILRAGLRTLGDSLVGLPQIVLVEGEGLQAASIASRIMPQLVERAVRFQCHDPDELNVTVALKELRAQYGGGDAEVSVLPQIIVAMNSTEDPELRCYRVIRSVEMLPGLVLDAGNSTALQRAVLEDGGEYIPQAETISDVAIYRVLHRNRFAEEVTSVKVPAVAFEAK